MSRSLREPVERNLMANEVDGYRIARATTAEIPAITLLQEKNLRANGGELSIRFSQHWFEQVVSEMPIIVAYDGVEVVGYIVSTELRAQAHDPTIRAMLDAYQGASGAYNYGPICVAREHRGRHLASRMFKELKAMLPGREGLTFIRTGNHASRAFHLKLGLKEVAEFSFAGESFVVAAFRA